MLGRRDAGAASKLVGKLELQLQARSAAADGLPVETRATNN
jgi:hypothetical protein